MAGGPAFLSDSSYTPLKPFPGASSLTSGGGQVAQEEVAGYLKTAEVADMLHVSPKTVTRWAKDGKLPHSRTLGGHRRFPAEEIRKLAAQLVQVDNL
jgi:excisionase family DNA binding protein